MILFDYDEWISRERKIRIELLKSSSLIRESKIYRICKDCGEICLCHEDRCPNCNFYRIIECLLVEDLEKIWNGLMLQYFFLAPSSNNLMGGSPIEKPRPARKSKGKIS